MSLTAAAEEIILDYTVATVLSEPDGIFISIWEKRMTLKALEEKMAFLKLLTDFGKSLVKNRNAAAKQ